MSIASENTGAGSRRRLLVVLPLLVFIALAALFFYRLGSGDPSRIPSALIGREVPQTDLPPVAGLVHDGKPLPGLNARGLQGQCHAGECLGVVVRAVP